MGDRPRLLPRSDSRGREGSQSHWAVVSAGPAPPASPLKAEATCGGCWRGPAGCACPWLRPAPCGQGSPGLFLGELDGHAWFSPGVGAAGVLHPGGRAGTAPRLGKTARRAQKFPREAGLDRSALYHVICEVSVRYNAAPCSGPCRTVPVLRGGDCGCPLPLLPSPSAPRAPHQIGGEGQEPGPPPLPPARQAPCPPPSRGLRCRSLLCFQRECQAKRKHTEAPGPCFFI